jgi:hypothetical protein
MKILMILLLTGSQAFAQDIWKSTLNQILNSEVPKSNSYSIDTLESKAICVSFTSFYDDGFKGVSEYYFSKKGKLFLMNTKIYNNSADDSKAAMIDLYESQHKSYEESTGMKLQEGIYPTGNRYFAFTIEKTSTDVTVLNEDNRYFLSINETKR